jgi:hypothetical protein
MCANPHRYIQMNLGLCKELLVRRKINRQPSGGPATPVGAHAGLSNSLRVARIQNAIIVSKHADNRQPELRCYSKFFHLEDHSVFSYKNVRVASSIQ